MIEIPNLGEFVEGLKAWVAECEDLAEGAFRGLAVDAFKHCVWGTPEWSGEMVSQWKLTVGAPSIGYIENPFKAGSFGGAASLRNPEPWSLRNPNPEAISYAFQVAEESIPSIRLGADVFITNATPYADAVRQDRGPSGKSLRLVNQPTEMLFSAISHGESMGDISESSAVALSLEKLG